MLPHSQFVGCANTVAQKRIAENLETLEKELRQVGSEADAAKLADAVAVFRSQVLEKPKKRPKAKQPERKKSEPRTTWPDACFYTSYEQKERIHQNAKRAGMNYGDYVLKQALEAPGG